MGLHDRDYARDGHDDRRFSVAVAGWSATTWLIAVNVVVFVMWLAATDNPDFNVWMKNHFLVSNVGVLEHFYIHTLVTSMFSHQEVWHLLMNMLFLYWCGKVLEDDIYGGRDFAALYLIAGLSGSLADLFLTAVSYQPDVPALGASGAVMGIVVCCACYYPSRPVLFMMLIPIQLKYLAMIFVGMDLLAFLSQAQDGIGHVAHLGGALAGYLFFKFDWRIFRDRASSRVQRRSLWGRMAGMLRPRPQLRVIEGGKSRPPLDDVMPERPRKIDAETGRRVDELLAKISREGQGALTDEERAFLEEASRKYKK